MIILPIKYVHLLLGGGETSDIESLNSLILKYANKTYAYKCVYSSFYGIFFQNWCTCKNIHYLVLCALKVFISRWLSMYMRSILAVLDFNHNVDRPQKCVDGKPIYKMKVIYKTVIQENKVKSYRWTAGGNSARLCQRRRPRTHLGSRTSWKTVSQPW